MFGTLRNLLKNEDGATAIEYGLIAALVAVAIIGVLTALGNSLFTTFNTVSTKLDAASSGAGSGTTP
ncbi:MAG: Flp family type IVb pilin [Acetobacteraceae bacterium]|nr:Flp family type IVb pilin [Acetobacteraceae bacterium]